MNNLIIIGNGFDLAHNLKTSYLHFIDDLINQCINGKCDYIKNIPKNISSVEDFLKFCKNSEYALYNELDEGFTFSFLYNIIEDRSTNLWCDIEKKYYKYLSSIEPGRVKGLNDGFEKIKDKLQEYLKIQQENGTFIKSYNDIFQTLASSNSLVVNFNYTNTLSLYPNSLHDCKCLHIHGELLSESNPIIFGYAADNSAISELLDKDDNEYLRNIKRYAYKRTNNEAILSDYLEEKKDIYIHFFGHSCGISDSLILNEILNHEHVNSILVYYYDNYESYYQITTNIHRIVRDNNTYKKIRNFKNSCRMPQKDDNSKEQGNIRIHLERLLNEYRLSQPYYPDIMIV